MPSIIRIFALSAGGLYLWLMVVGSFAAILMTLRNPRAWYGFGPREPERLAEVIPLPQVTEAHARQRHPAGRETGHEERPLTPWQVSALAELEESLRRTRLARAYRSADREQQ